jgi:hypothetical protein
VYTTKSIVDLGYKLKKIAGDPSHEERMLILVIFIFTFLTANCRVANQEEAALILLGKRTELSVDDPTLLKVVGKGMEKINQLLPNSSHDWL